MREERERERAIGGEGERKVGRLYL